MNRVAARWPLLALAAAPLGWLLPEFYLAELSHVLVLAIAALGLTVLTGWTGQVSLGQSAFVAIGGYGHALLLAAGCPFVPALLLAAVLAALAGVAVGLPAIRISGLHLAMVTMACAIVVEHLAGRWSTVTGGHAGLPVAQVQVFGQSLARTTVFYSACVTVLALAWALLAGLLRGATGRAWRALRDAEPAARMAGVPVARYKVAAFALSAALCGLAGALMAHQLRHLTPDAFGLALAIQLLVVVFVGGLGSLGGALLGAALVGLLPQAIAELKPLLPRTLALRTGLEAFVHGAILVFFVLVEPRGLVGLRARWSARPARRRVYARTERGA